MVLISVAIVMCVCARVPVCVRVSVCECVLYAHRPFIE